jgi:hypothetical protein
LPIAEVHGRLDSFDDQHVALTSENRHLELPLSIVTRLDVSRGRAPWTHGALRGGIIGAVVGFLGGVAYSAIQNGHGNDPRPVPGGRYRLGVIGGAVLGAGVGAEFRGTRWEQAYAAPEDAPGSGASGR